MSDLYIFIGCYPGNNAYNTLKSKYFKSNISVSNSEYERMLFEAFNLTEDCVFISAPTVGRFPVSCKKIFYRKFISEKNIYDCSFITVPGLNNCSKSLSLKKALKKLLKVNKKRQVNVIACEAHKPYLDAMKIAKKHGCATLLIVPDTPSSMVYSKNPIYKFFKKKNVESIKRISKKYIDSFVYFTEGIKNEFDINKPFLIREGIIEKFNNSLGKDKNRKLCLYIGKTDNRNGIDFIIESAKKMSDYTFNVYGSGDCDEKLKTISLNNLHFYGFIKPDGIDEIIKENDILLSPRTNDPSYTGLSFPSKVIKYISYCKPIITFKLPCYSKQFDPILIYPKNESVEDFVASIKSASNFNGQKCFENSVENLSYLLAENLVKDIMVLFGKTV